MDRVLYWLATRTVWEKLAVVAVPLVLGLACICPMTAVWSAQQAAVQHAAETAEAAPSATALAVARATQTAEAIPTSTHTPRPTSTPTVAPPPPTVDVSDCTLNAAFEADITVPDDTPVLAGSPFTKTWRIRNTGTCAWGPGYRLTFIDGEQMGGPDSVQLPDTSAGGEADVSVALVAPSEAGRYRGYWQVCVNEAQCFGDRMHVDVVALSAEDVHAAAYSAALLPLLEEIQATHDAVMLMMNQVSQNPFLALDIEWAAQFQALSSLMGGQAEHMRALPSPPPEFTGVHNELMRAADHWDWLATDLYAWICDPLDHVDDLYQAVTDLDGFTRHLEQAVGLMPDEYP